MSQSFLLPAPLAIEASENEFNGLGSPQDSTLAAYDARAQEFSLAYEAKSEPPLKALFERWLVNGASILEIGCGSGRDARWLVERGMRVLATDGSINMLTAAANRAKAAGIDLMGDVLQFTQLRLPAAAQNAKEVSDILKRQSVVGSSHAALSAPFDAVIAVGVLQHLSETALTQTATFLEAALSNSGILIVSIPTNHPGDRTTTALSAQRQYFNRPAEYYGALFERFGFAEVERETSENAGAATYECTWATIVFTKIESRRQARANLTGLIENDSKTSTYKFALVRALCDVNICNPGRVRYVGGPSAGYPVETVAIPFELIIERVIEYYWQIFRRKKHAPSAPAQIGGGRRLAFEEQLLLVMREHCFDWHVFHKDFYNGTLEAEHTSQRRTHLLELFDCVAASLKKGPVYFAGNSLRETAQNGTHNRLFSVSSARRRVSELTPHKLSERYGELFMPANIWRELNFSAPFVIDSVQMQWAKLSQRFSELQGQQFSLGQILETMIPTEDQRDVALADKVFRERIRTTGAVCVWTDRPLTIKTLAVDHLLLWSRLHTNDLWNLVPTWNKANGRKSDLIPSTQLLLSSQTRIMDVWRLLENSSLGSLFRAQAESSLTGKSLPGTGWETPLFDALLGTAEYVSRQFSAARWDGRTDLS